MLIIAKAKSVKADLAKKEISISFTMPMNDENTETANELSQYVGKDAGHVELSITPRQIPMFKTGKP